METKGRLNDRTRTFIYVNTITLPLLIKTLSPTTGHKKL